MKSLLVLLIIFGIESAVVLIGVAANVMCANPDPAFTVAGVGAVIMLWASLLLGVLIAKLLRWRT